MDLHRRLYPSKYLEKHTSLKVFLFAYKEKPQSETKRQKKMYETCHRNIEDRELQTHYDMTH